MRTVNHINGEGDEELIRTSNLLKRGFAARGTAGQGALPNSRNYKVTQKEDTDVQMADESHDDDGAPLTDLATMVRGPSRFGLFMFYYAKIPGAMYLKNPGVILALSVLRHTIGIGALAPIRAVLKDAWIIIRLFLDFPTEAAIHLSFWFWEFCAP